MKIQLDNETLDLVMPYCKSNSVKPHQLIKPLLMQFMQQPVTHDEEKKSDNTN